MMHSNGEVEYEEELDFHLETASDTSLDNDNTWVKIHTQT